MLRRQRRRRPQGSRLSRGGSIWWCGGGLVQKAGVVGGRGRMCAAAKPLVAPMVAFTPKRKEIVIGL